MGCVFQNPNSKISACTHNPLCTVLVGNGSLSVKYTYCLNKSSFWPYAHNTVSIVFNFKDKTSTSTTFIQSFGIWPTSAEKKIQNMAAVDNFSLTSCTEFTWASIVFDMLMFWEGDSEKTHTYSRANSV